LWTNTTNGTITNWLATPEAGFTSNFDNSYVAPPLTWHVVGLGDFNGDSREDMLWRLDDWLGNGTLSVVLAGAGGTWDWENPAFTNFYSVGAESEWMLQPK
jgi:hypothetical protein